MSPRWLPVLALAALCACERQTTMDDLQTRPVTLPDGTVVRCEVVYNPLDMARGFMFRDRVPPDRGMLFVHTAPGTYAYWMYQVRVPLDIIWLDQNKRVAEISANTPPCTSASARQCPSYGGNKQSQFIVELAGGEAARHNVRLGSRIDF